MTDDQQEREVRARRLRKQIGEIVGGKTPESNESVAEQQKPEESPREFVERRMRELKKERKQN